MNPVEKLYAAWPAYLYLNASLCGAMLVPLLEAQAGAAAPEYALPDLGERTVSWMGSSMMR